LIALHGGKCKRCGYDKCAAALEFHHMDPDSKEFGLAQRGETRSLARMIEESMKCVLLCSNCHKELHFGVD